MRSAVLVDVVVRADQLLHVLADDHAGANRAGACREEQDAADAAGEGVLHEAHSDRHCNTRGSQRPGGLGDRLGVPLKLLNDRLKRELALGQWEQEATMCQPPSGALSSDNGVPILHDGGLGALWPLALSGNSGEAEHLSDLLRSDLLVAAEDVGLGAVLERELIDLHLCESEPLSVTHAWHTVWPKVIRPTRAFSGRRLSDRSRESFKA